MKTAVQFISFSVFSSGQNSGTIQTTFEVEAPLDLIFSRYTLIEMMDPKVHCQDNSRSHQTDNEDYPS